MFPLSMPGVRIYVQVPQAYSANLAAGLKATYELRQYPGRKFDATLVTRSHAMNAASRSMLVQLQADNPEGKLLGDTFAGWISRFRATRT
jgi:hypothetical protein